MPFGSIFGALFFGVFCGSIGLRWLVHPTLEGKLGGAMLATLGASLALGLLMRRNWARWVGGLVGAMLAAHGLRLAAIRGGVLDHVLLLAAIAATVLLVVPTTGNPARGATARAVVASKRIGAVGWTAFASLVGLLAVGFSADTVVAPPGAVREGSLPAAAIGQRVRWSGFSEGLARAREEGRPVLATFVTDWCPYCTKMARGTWRSSAVVERVEDFVLVKVDMERGEGIGGQELAARYGVSGYPVQMVLDGEGRPIGRFDGYQSAQELLAWLDDVSPDAGAVDRQPARHGTFN